MARLKIYKDNYADATVVSNRFIDVYMKDANDAQLKVYFYLIRMLNANQPISVTDIADKFNHTEKDVMRSLKYWEKQHILTLEYDADKNLSGIHLCDLNEDNAKAKAQSVTSVQVPVYTAVQPVMQPVAQPTAAPAMQSVAQPTVVPAMQSAAQPTVAPVAEKKTFTKPSYSLDQLSEFKNRENSAQLIFVAEQYIGKPLTPTEMKTIIFFTDVLHFSDDLIDFLLQYCVGKGKKDFHYIEAVAIAWAEKDVTTPKQAQRYTAKYDKNVYTIMNELGKTSSPTSKEFEYINRWTNEYGFSVEIIIEACERTVLATDKHRFEYAEGILNQWKSQNVHHKSDIKRIDEMYHKRMTTSTKTASSAGKYNQFSKNSYDFEALEKQLLSN